MRSRHVWTAIVATACLAVALLTYRGFLDQSDQLWTVLDHDRNAHYVTVLQLASDLRSANLVSFVKHFVGLAVWPPGYYLGPAVLLAVAGPDLRLAVLPSALAWAGCGVLAFLIARRCVKSGGTAAGLVAAAFVLASPMHHAYAVDLMIENTGTFLTLLCLFAYIVAVQDESPTAYARLGLALTALLITKYNYWLLIVLALGLVELGLRGAAHLAWLRQALPPLLSWRPGLLDGAIALFAAGVAAVCVIRPGPFEIAGQSVRLYPPGNAFQALYALVLVRIGMGLWPWRGSVGALEVRSRAMVWWHVIPAALFMALPRHLTTFVWYVSPLNAPTVKRTLWEGMTFYGDAVLNHYHPSALACLAAAGLFVLGLALSRRMNTGAAAVFVLAALSALLTVRHPNHQERYAMSWLPVLWVGAGVGLVGWLGYVVEGWRRQAARFVVVPAALALAVLVPAIVSGKRSPLGGPRADVPTQAGLARAVVEETRGNERAVVLQATPARFLVEWALLEADGRTSRVEYRWFGFQGKGLDNRTGFAAWLERPTADVVLCVDVPGQDRDPVCEALVAAHRELMPMLEASRGFRLVRTREFGAIRLRVYHANQ